MSDTLQLAEAAALRAELAGVRAEVAVALARIDELEARVASNEHALAAERSTRRDEVAAVRGEMTDLRTRLVNIETGVGAHSVALSNFIEEYRSGETDRRKQSEYQTEKLDLIGRAMDLLIKTREVESA